MAMTPVFPALLEDRPLTAQEMLDAVQYEGLFGIGSPEDFATAGRLRDRGELEIMPLHGGWAVVNCKPFAGRTDRT